MANFLAETTTWYILCWLFMLARFIFKGWGCRARICYQLNFFVVVAMAATTASYFVFLHLQKVQSNLPPLTRTKAPWQLSPVGPVEVEALVRASEWRAWADQSHIMALVALKASILAMYLDTAWLTRQRIVIRIIGAITACAFLVVEVFYFWVWCKPFNHDWAPTHASRECFVMVNHQEAKVIADSSTSVLMLCIPVFALSHSGLTFGKRALVGCFIFFGAFPIVAGVVAQLESTRSTFGENWASLCMRELLWAMTLVNVPGMCSLVEWLINFLSRPGKWGNRFGASGGMGKGWEESIPLQHSYSGSSSSYSSYVVATERWDVRTL